MALTPATRTGLTKYTAGSDPHPGRVKFNEQVDLLDAIIALAYQGNTVSRPPAGKAGRFYWDTEVLGGRLYWDDGTAWREVTTNGGGGAGRAIVPGTAGTEGTSGRSARADHTHELPLATNAQHGAMRKEDKALLDTATTNAVYDALMRRDGNGRVSVSTPVSPSQATTKAYVDGQITAAAAYVDGKVGQGVGMFQWTPLNPTVDGFESRGTIWSASLLDHTIVIGNVSIHRLASAGSAFVDGGNIAYTDFGQIIPTQLKDPRPGNQVSGILNGTFLTGNGQFEGMQSFVQQTTGKIMFRAPTAAGVTWKAIAQVNVDFVYVIDTPTGRPQP
jgi:hypothetical protein